MNTYKTIEGAGVLVANKSSEAVGAVALSVAALSALAIIGFSVAESLDSEVEGSGFVRESLLPVFLSSFGTVIISFGLYWMTHPDQAKK